MDEASNGFLERLETLETRIDTLEKASMEAEKKVEEEESDKCPGCGNAVGWNNLEVKRSPDAKFPWSIVEKSEGASYKECPECGYMEEHTVNQQR